MQTGKMNQRVKLQQLAAGQDAIGQMVQTWSDVASVWARILHKTGVQVLKSDADVSLMQIIIRIRRRTDITAGMRVLHGTTAYDIKGVLQNEDNRQHTDLVCELVA